MVEEESDSKGLSVMSGLIVSIPGPKELRVTTGISPASVSAELCLLSRTPPSCSPEEGASSVASSLAFLRVCSGTSQVLQAVLQSSYPAQGSSRFPFSSALQLKDRSVEIVIMSHS